MSIIEKFRDIMGVSDGEEYDGRANLAASDSEYYDDETDDIADGTNFVANNRNVPQNTSQSTMAVQVVLVKPEKFEDASQIADHLNAKRTVVLNLESTSKEVSRRLVDFLSGVAYANNGQIKRVANSTFIITPYNVGVSGDLIDELENSGVVF